MRKIQLMLSLVMTMLLSACNKDTPDKVWTLLGSGTALGCYAFVGGLVLGMVLPRSKKRGKRRRSKEMSKGSESTTPLPAVTSTDYALENENSQLRRELHAAQDRIAVLQRILAETEHLLKADMQERVPTAPQPSAAVLYFLQPSNDGRFKATGKVNDKADALYELKIETGNPAEAHFCFVDTADNTSFALQNEANWILVACERSNVATARTTAIRTDVSGKAVLKGEDWEIVRKAKISYV